MLTPTRMLSPTRTSIVVDDQGPPRSWPSRSTRSRLSLGNEVPNDLHAGGPLDSSLA